MKAKEYKKRRLGRVFFELGNDIKLGTSLLIFDYKLLILVIA